MQIISNFATLAIPRMWHAGGICPIVAADGHNVLIVKEMLNYKKGLLLLEQPCLLKQQ